MSFNTLDLEVLSDCQWLIGSLRNCLSIFQGWVRFGESFLITTFFVLIKLKSTTSPSVWIFRVGPDLKVTMAGHPLSSLLYLHMTNLSHSEIWTHLVDEQ